MDQDRFGFGVVGSRRSVTRGGTQSTNDLGGSSTWQGVPMWIPAGDL